MAAAARLRQSASARIVVLSVGAASYRAALEELADADGSGIGSVLEMDTYAELEV